MLTMKSIPAASNVSPATASYGECRCTQEKPLLTFVFLQSFLRGLKDRFMELLGKFLRSEAVPGFCASVDAVKPLFGLQRERGPQTAEQTGAPP